jgi:hypothetical protein
MFGHRNLEKDPKVWSYGIEYTPVPLVSGFINQRSTERGRTDTEFGLNFTYHFEMPFEDQLQHSKVAELRTVSGSRHEFVDRENRIILEYRDKESYRIEYLGLAGPNRFLFRVLDGFDEFADGQRVYVTTAGIYLVEAEPAQPASLFAQAAQFLDGLISVRAAQATDRFRSYITDSRGEFVVELEPAAPMPLDVTIRAGDNEQTFTLNGGAADTGSIGITAFSDGPDFSSGNLYSTASLTVNVADTDGQPVSGATVTWTVETARNNSPAMMSGWESRKTGLTWGATPEADLDYSELALERIPSATNNTSATDSSGEATMQLTDIVGERVITVKAEVTIGGTTYSVTQDVSFGNGPLSVFKAPVGTTSPWLTWDEAYQACNNSAYTGDYSTGWHKGAYVGGGKMPTLTEMQAVSSYYTGGTIDNPNTDAQGAAFAAGWRNVHYGFWTGDARFRGFLYIVNPTSGYDGWQQVYNHFPVACRR